MKKLKDTLLLLLLTWSACQLSAQNNTVDFDKFIEQTQISNTEDDKLIIGWWIPVEFWELTFREDQTMTDEQKKEFVDLLAPYTMFAVVDGNVGPFGGVSYGSEEEMAESMTLLNTWGIKHKPLEVENLPNDIQNLLSVFKPILKNMLGEMGQNMNFYVFDDISEGKERIFDPVAEGELRLQFNGEEVMWATPITSLLPLKICPNDDAQLNGAWKYCPFHGDKLKEQSEK